MTREGKGKQENRNTNKGGSAYFLFACKSTELEGKRKMKTS